MAPTMHPFYDLPPHPSSPSSPSAPAPTFLVVLPSMTRGYRPPTSTSRSNSVFVGSPSSSMRDLSPSSRSSSISGRASASAASGPISGTSPSRAFGFGSVFSTSGRKEMTAKLLDGKNSLFASVGDAAGDRRRLSISALPMPLGNNMGLGNKSKRVVGKEGSAATAAEAESRSKIPAGQVDLTSDRQEEGEEEDEPGRLLGRATEKLLWNAKTDSSTPVPGSRAGLTAGNQTYTGSAGVSPRGSIPKEVSPTATPPSFPTSSATPSNAPSTLKSYEYPPRDTVSPATKPKLSLPKLSPPTFHRATSSSYSPRSTSEARKEFFQSPTGSKDVKEAEEKTSGTPKGRELTYPTTGTQAQTASLPPPPFGGFRRSTSHKGDFPETIDTQGASTSNPSSTPLPLPPFSPSGSKLRTIPLNPPRARSSRRRPQTSSAALSGFGSNVSEATPRGSMESSRGGETDSDADIQSPLASDHPGGGFGSGPTPSRMGTSAFPRRSERQSSNASSLSRKSGSMGTGRPGWEGDELVGVLREDGMQVTTLRTSSQMAQHLRHLTDNQAAARFSSGTSSPRSAPRQVALNVLLVPLSDSPTLPSLSLLLAQGTTPSAVCFQQDLLDRARRTEADWLPSALDMISLAARTSRRASVPDANFDLPRLLVVAYSANPGLAPTVVTRCIEAGAIGVLQPPYDQEETFGKIQHMIALAASTNLNNGDDSLHVPDVIPGQAEAIEEEIAEVVGLVEEVKEEMIAAPTSQPSVTQNLYASWAAYDHASRRRSIDTGGLALALKRATEQSAFGDNRNRSRLGQQQVSRSAMHSPAKSPLLTPTAEETPRTDRSASLHPDDTTHPEIEALRIKAEQKAREGDDTALAELLSEMYRQTKLTIDIQMGDYDAISAPLSKGHRSRLIAQMSSWDFRPHRLSDADLFRCSCLVFEAVLRLDGLQQLSIDQDQLQRFLFALRAIYHSPNPYHNYVHAVDVVQSSYMFMVQIGVAPPLNILEDANEQPWRRPELPEAEDVTEDHARRHTRSILRPQDVLAVMIGAMGHDVGHPGLSNAFMKNAKTPLSQVYEDKSVLENMHCMLIVQLLRKHGFGFLLSSSSSSADQFSPLDYAFSLPATPLSPSTDISSLSRQEGAVTDFRGFKKLLVETVLATDMSIHFAWIRSFQDLGKKFRAEEYESPEERGPGEDEHDRVILCQAIIKCADISNPTRPIDISEHWSTVLLEEWSKQASLEQELQLPSTVVASADAALQAKGQIGFIDLFTLPLFEAAAYALPDFQYFADACSENRAIWVGRLEEFQAIEQEASLALASENGDDATPDSPSVANSIRSQARHKPVFQASTEPTLLDERYRSLFPMSLPVSLAQTMSAEYGLSESGDALLDTSLLGGGNVPSTPRTRSTTAPEPGSPSGERNARGDDADRSPAQAMREAYRLSVRRQTSRQGLKGSNNSGGDGKGSSIVWKSFGGGKGVEVS